MKKIAFTICSNNYLAQAKVLSDSLNIHSADYHFIIGLCDKMSSLIDYSVFKNCTIIEVDTIGIPNFNKMYLEYDIIELNTSVKPFLFIYLFEKFKSELIYYIDPDICIFDSLQCIENEMTECDILLTPHIYTPIPQDGCIPQENIFLNYGIYNLGFLALKRSDNANNLLNWWSLKLDELCLNRVADGYFVDQLPMNLAPLFFDKVRISSNWGLNVAYWNFHERRITFENQTYFVNENIALVLFHFSNYKVTKREQITSFFNRFSMADVPAIQKLYTNYYEQLIANRFVEYTEVPCVYVQKRYEYLQLIKQAHDNQTTHKVRLLRAVKRRLPKQVLNFLHEFSKL